MKMYELRLFDSKLLTNAPVCHHVKEFVQECYKHTESVDRRLTYRRFRQFFGILGMETDFLPASSLSISKILKEAILLTSSENSADPDQTAPVEQSD